MTGKIAKSPSDGFALTELLVALVILSFLTMILGSLLVSTTRVSHHQSATEAKVGVIDDLLFSRLNTFTAGLNLATIAKVTTQSVVEISFQTGADFEEVFLGKISLLTPENNSTENVILELTLSQRVQRILTPSNLNLRLEVLTEAGGINWVSLERAVGLDVSAVRILGDLGQETVPVLIWSKWQS